MAHDLYKNSMIYTGETPWHGLGQKLPTNATWEEVKDKLPFYTVLERELFVPGIPTAIPDKKALIASDNGRYLATVGKDYGVVQFSDLAEAVCKAIGREAVINTAGLLGENGTRAWIQGELSGDPLEVKGDSSPIRRYFVATTSHDGMHAAQLANVATRVVCRNTLGSALGERDGARWSIRHTSRAADRVQAAGLAFKSLVKGMEQFGKLANEMASTQFLPSQVAAVLNKILPMPTDKLSRSYENVFAKHVKIAELADGAMIGGSGIVGTQWGAFQAFTEYADHHSKIRAGNQTEEQARLNSVWFGSAAAFKQEALAAILAA